MADVTKFTGCQFIDTNPKLDPDKKIIPTKMEELNYGIDPTYKTKEIIYEFTGCQFYSVGIPEKALVKNCLFFPNGQEDPELG